FHQPRTPIVSTIDGAPYDARPPGAYPDFLASQFTEPVRLREAFRNAHARGIRLFLEAGPRWSLTQFARASLQEVPHAACASIHPGVGEVEQFHRLLACCFVHRVGALESSTPVANGATMSSIPAADPRIHGPGPAGSVLRTPTQGVSPLEALLALPLHEVLDAQVISRMEGALASHLGAVVPTQSPASNLGEVIGRVAE